MQALNHLTESLKPTEADVLIVTRTFGGVIKIYPYWECELISNELEKACARFTLQDAEDSGIGFAEGIVLDYRDANKEAELKK